MIEITRTVFVTAKGDFVTKASVTLHYVHNTDVYKDGGNTFVLCITGASNEEVQNTISVIINTLADMRVELNRSGRGQGPRA